MVESFRSDPVSNLRTDVERYLRQFSGGDAVFIPNPGNAGDCLILQGTLSAFERADVQIVVTDRSSDITGKIVFIGGGGNLIDLYRDMRKAIEVCRGKASKIVLLPHTIRGNADLIRSFDENITLWCRDTHSLEHVRRLNSRVESLLGHDMALHCDVRQLLASEELARSGWPALRTALARANTSIESLTQRPVVRYMRTDKEALHRGTQSDLDISRAFGSVADLHSSAVTTWCFLQIIAQSQRIVTDRLHVAIGAALLGRPCELHDNSYNKNRGVYEQSLIGFPTLSFVQTGGATIPDQPVRDRPSIFNSAQRRMQRLYRN